MVEIKWADLMNLRATIARSKTGNKSTPGNSQLKPIPSFGSQHWDYEEQVDDVLEADTNNESETEEQETQQPEERVQLINMTEVNFPSSILHVQPNKFNGTSKGQSWIQEFDRWSKLHKLSNEQAAQALPFYLDGSAKLWFDGLPDATQTNYAQLKDAMTKRFASRHEDDDIFITQAPTELAVEFLDRLQIKAASQNIPDHLRMRIAIKGFRQTLRNTILQRNPQTYEELRTAANIAERVEKDAKQGAQINAITNDNIQILQDTINALTKKVENLDTQNKVPHYDGNYRQQRQPNYNQLGNSSQNRAPQFGNSGQNRTQHFGNGGQNRTPNFGNPNWGQNNYNKKPQSSFQPRPQNSENKASCTTCGIPKCSGNPDNCFAIGKQCSKCFKIGHFAQVCRSIYNINGDKLRR